MKTKERIRYNVQGRDITGKNFCRSEVITDTGNDTINNDYIKTHLKEEFKMAKNLVIEKVETGSILEIPKEELKRDALLAIEDAKTLSLGFASKLPKSMQKELGIGLVKKLDDPNFHIILILVYCYDGKSQRDIESEKLGVYALFYHGGHIFGRILNKKYNLYKEHKNCLNDDDLNDIFKKMNIYNVTKTHTIKTSIQFSDAIKELALMINKSNLKQKQKDIDDWIE